MTQAERRLGASEDVDRDQLRRRCVLVGPCSTRRGQEPLETAHNACSRRPGGPRRASRTPRQTREPPLSMVARLGETADQRTFRCMSHGE